MHDRSSCTKPAAVPAGGINLPGARGGTAARRVPVPRPIQPPAQNGLWSRLPGTWTEHHRFAEGNRSFLDGYLPSSGDVPPNQSSPATPVTKAPMPPVGRWLPPRRARPSGQGWVVNKSRVTAIPPDVHTCRPGPPATEVAIAAIAAAAAAAKPGPRRRREGTRTAGPAGLGLGSGYGLRNVAC